MNGKPCLWAVRDASGRILRGTARPSKRDAVAVFLQWFTADDTWKRAYGRGYRLVRVAAKRGVRA